MEAIQKNWINIFRLEFLIFNIWLKTASSGNIRVAHPKLLGKTIKAYFLFIYYILLFPKVFGATLVTVIVDAETRASQTDHPKEWVNTRR